MKGFDEKNSTENSATGNNSENSAANTSTINIANTTANNTENNEYNTTSIQNLSFDDKASNTSGVYQIDSAMRNDSDTVDRFVDVQNTDASNTTTNSTDPKEKNVQGRQTIAMNSVNKTNQIYIFN